MSEEGFCGQKAKHGFCSTCERDEWKAKYEAAREVALERLCCNYCRQHFEVDQEIEKRLAQRKT